jgi:ribosomal protein S24E
MDITIEKTNENMYLQRKEVHGKVSFQGATPSNKQLADALATKLGVKVDTISVRNISTTFGAQAGVFEAHVYTNKEALDKVVRLGKKAKEKIAKAAGAAPAAAPAAAAPAAAPAPAAEAPKPEVKKETPKPAEEKKPAAAEAKKEAPAKAEAKA